jgi:hypothetical protein
MMQGFTNTASDLKLFDQVVGESGSQTVLLEIKVPKKAVNKPIKNPD